MTKLRVKVATFLILALPVSAIAAVKDPTQGKPFFPWMWEEQIRPVLDASVEKNGLRLLSSGAVATVVAHQYDTDVFEHNQRKELLIFNDEVSGYLGTLGGGVFAIGIAATQIVYDQDNGLKHLRAMTLTAFSHVSLAYAVGRGRPGGRGDYLPFKSSFPSGHASSAFATASSLAYAYGWKAGFPSFAVASSIALARVSENAHWLSDVVAGATLGMFWARASYAAGDTSTLALFQPVPVPGGLIVSFKNEF